MFKLLNLFRPTPEEIASETMRARFERVTAELNEVLAGLDPLPKISIDAQARQIEIEAPSQFADEALALPEPSAEERDAPLSDTPKAEEDAQEARQAKSAEHAAAQDAEASSDETTRSAA